jgi:hypothetical protein
VAWNTARPEDQGSVSGTACGAYGAGLCFTGGQRVDEDGERVGTWYGYGPVFGTELSATADYQILNIDFQNHGKRNSLPQDPIPPSINDRICQMAWWC